MKISKGIGPKVLKTALYGLFLFFVVFILLEIFLRVYDPFKFRIQTNGITLPANQTTFIKNTLNPELDSLIVNTKNSIGLRGPDTTIGYSNQVSIITVGGSATRCHFLSDNKTWPFLLGEYLKKDFPDIWVNNAGFDGQSTFGHQVLLEKYLVRLHPKVITFLTGVNDIQSDGPSFFDKIYIKNAYPSFVQYIYNNSEVIYTVVNIIRGGRTPKFDNTTQELKMPGYQGELKMTRDEINERLRSQEKYVESYKQRLVRLAETCLQNNILPVFITQPCLYGYGRDSITGANLATAKLEDGMNGELLLDIIQLYNGKMKEVSINKKIPCIDLAKLMPKNSLYYYDQTHFTNEGAELVARLLQEKFKDILGRY